MKLKNLELWKYLRKGEFEEEEDEDLARKFSSNLLDICKNATNRIKDVRRSFPQYTLHDDVHLVNVVEIMGQIIPEGTLRRLNPIEIFLLILSAFFHDQGMVIDDNEFDQIKQNPEYQISLRNWDREYPNLKDLLDRLNLFEISEEDKEKLEELKIEFERGHLIEFIRKSHAKRSGDYFIETYNDDPRLEVNTVNISYLVALLCQSHTMNPNELNESNGFRYAEVVGKYKINMVFLAIILRLADILDFDRDRTPEVIFKSIKFKSEISLKEWHKHLAVYGKIITSREIQYTCWCETPQYEKAVRDFIQWIDNELSSSLTIIKGFPAEFVYYALELPPQVDTSQIGAKNGKYIYKDLEFSLSHKEIIKLFLLDELYSHKSLCVRELLQNALDALHHKRFLYKIGGAEWEEGCVNFSHYLNEDGYEVLRCEDNGIGMDLPIIENFLTKIGRSYYNSPEFHREAEEISSSGLKFHPNAIFGIGFLSCFMLGDRIKIITRKFYGVGKDFGLPYHIEINGISGILTITKGDERQPTGTIIEVIRRDKELYLYKYTDVINLINILDGYAICTEFPIEAKCEVSGIENEIQIESGIPSLATSMEKEGLEKILTFEQDFNDTDSRLGGKIRVSFLIDEEDQITLENNEACLEERKTSIVVRLKNGRNEKDINLSDINTKICFDGILVCGEPGRDKKPFIRTKYYNRIRLGNVFFILNVTKDLKGSLKQNRHAPTYIERNKKWLRLIELSELTSGRMWERILDKMQNKPNLFWKILLIYGGDPLFLREKVIWTKLSLPFKSKDNNYTWKKIDEVKKLEFHKIDKDHCSFKLDNELLLHAPDEFIEWTTLKSINREFQQLILSIGTLKIENNSPVITLNSPDDPEISPIQKFITVGYRVVRYFINYDPTFDDVIAIEIPVLHKDYSDCTVNRNNILSKEIINSRFNENPNDIEQFTIHVVGCLSDRQTFESLRKREFIPTLYMKYVGKYYLYLKSELPNKMQPPYRIWIADKGFIVIDDKLLEKWASAEVSIS